MNLIPVIAILNNLLNMVNGFISQGFYAVTDFRYDGFISDEAKEKYFCGKKEMISERMYYSVTSVKECKYFCMLIDDCRSFVIDRYDSICYASTFDRCDSSFYMTPLQYYPNFITYDIIPGANETTKTCFSQCLDSSNGNCSACGRMWCSGIGCDDCIKTCWDMHPLINGSTFFWRTLNTSVSVTCIEEWQLVFSSSSDKSYSEMNLEPLWLQMIVTLSNGSSYTSYFSNVTLSESKIVVGNYLGGAAGNFWNAPGTLSLKNFGNKTCNSFYYKTTNFNCNITTTQVDSFDDQIRDGVNFNDVKKGYVWKVCDPIVDSTTYVENIQLYVTPLNSSLTNSENLQGLPSC